MLNAIAIVVGSVVIGGSIIYAAETEQRLALQISGESNAFSNPVRVDLRDVQLELKNPEDLPKFPQYLNLTVSNPTNGFYDDLNEPFSVRLVDPVFE